MDILKINNLVRKRSKILTRKEFGKKMKNMHKSTPNWGNRLETNASSSRDHPDGKGARGIRGWNERVGTWNIKQRFPDGQRAGVAACYALLLAKLDVYYSFLPDAYNYTGPPIYRSPRISPSFLNENFRQQTTVCAALSYINYTRAQIPERENGRSPLSFSKDKQWRRDRENNFRITLRTAIYIAPAY